MGNRNGSTERIERSARLMWVPLSKMKVSPVAQRELKPARVDHLAANFDPEQMGYPQVNKREDAFYIIDGQHRVEAYKQWEGDGWESQNLECFVYFDLTDEEMADKFDRLNDVLAVHAFDKFRVRVTAGRDVESDIERVVRANGMTISRSSDGITAVGTLTKVYKRSDAHTLGRTVRIIRDAFGTAGFEATVIDGIGLLCARYNGDLDDQTAVDKLARTAGGVNGLTGKAEVLRKQTGNYKSHCVAAAAVEIINAGKGGKKLPSWWKG